MRDALLNSQIHYQMKPRFVVKHGACLAVCILALVGFPFYVLHRPDVQHIKLGCIAKHPSSLSVLMKAIDGSQTLADSFTLQSGSEHRPHTVF